MSITWHEWNDEAFAEARRRGSPVVLLLTASWCRWCRELERTVLADPRVQSLIGESFVAVRVDKDRRPDIDARYSKGGWPTLAYLDDAGELIASDAYLDVDPLCERLQVVAGYYAENRETIRRHLSEAASREAEGRSRGGVAAQAEHAPRGREQLSPAPVDWVARTLLDTADPIHGGWGTRHKFPHPEAIDFALIRWSQTGDEAMRKLVLRTLRQMQAGEIHDRIEGGFYRFATSPDWSGPHYEKMLDSNAQRLYAYLEAHQALGEESFRTTAEGILAWMQTTLLDPRTGAFRGSQDANPAYAHLTTLAARRELGAPPCDPTIFCNWNAMAVSALFKASVVLKDDSLREQALATLAFLMEELRDKKHGMYHYWDGNYHLPGMLTDQAYTLRALLDAVQFAGHNARLDDARELATLAIESLKSDGGAFYDTRHDPSARGGLRRRNQSILENAVMSEALLRLSHFTRDDDWAGVAIEALGAFSQDYRRYGHFVAGYARALDLVFHPPVHVTVVGAPEDPETQALRAAALEPYVASRLVQVIDPTREAALLLRLGLPSIGLASSTAAGSGGAASAARPSAGMRARAFVHRGRESYAETSDPVRLPALMARIERATAPEGTKRPPTRLP